MDVFLHSFKNSNPEAMVSTGFKLITGVEIVPDGYHGRTFSTAGYNAGIEGDSTWHDFTQVGEDHKWEDGPINLPLDNSWHRDDCHVMLVDNLAKIPYVRVLEINAHISDDDELVIQFTSRIDTNGVYFTHEASEITSRTRLFGSTVHSVEINQPAYRDSIFSVPITVLLEKDNTTYQLDAGIDLKDGKFQLNTQSLNEWEEEQCRIEIYRRKIGEKIGYCTITDRKKAGDNVEYVVVTSGNDIDVARYVDGRIEWSQRYFLDVSSTVDAQIVSAEDGVQVDWTVKMYKHSGNSDPMEHIAAFRLREDGSEQARPTYGAYVAGEFADLIHSCYLINY